MSTYFKDYYVAHKDRIDEHNKKYYLDNKEKYKRNNKAFYQMIKEEAYQIYGVTCSCCGESIRKFLTLDHVQNDGNIHKRQLKSRSTMAVLLDLRKRKWPKIMETRCFNCNCGRALNKGICPHNV